jgi:signal transduction histidine kinase
VLLMVLSCVALLGMRRRPELAWAVAFGCSVLDTVVAGVASAVVVQAVVALFPVAVLRRTRTMVGTAVTTLVTYSVLAVLVTGSWVAALSVIPSIVAAAALGVAVRNQRRALVSAQLRALQAEATREEEAQRRVAEERLRIAQELHDVIAHHVSVINVQSGVARHLMNRDPASAETALDAVREASRAALNETAQLVGLLRSGEDGLPTQPAAGLDRLDALVDATRRAGLDVQLQEVGRRRVVPAAVDLIAFRVVQEALTNALKHGAGSARLRVEHSAGAVTLDVRNPLRLGRATVAGSGRGLIGMRERMSTVGGTLRTGPDDEGQFAVHAEIPLEAR